MRRFCSNFPDGLPGAGLLILRVGIGVKLIAFGLTGIIGSGLDPGALAAAVIPAIVGISLLVGFLTRLAGGLCALTVVVHYLWHSDPFLRSMVDLDGFVIATAILLLGPGAFSLDSRFFGRRKVIIPRTANP